VIEKLAERRRGLVALLQGSRQQDCNRQISAFVSLKGAERVVRRKRLATNGLDEEKESFLRDEMPLVCLWLEHLPHHDVGGHIPQLFIQGSGGMVVAKDV
jgi:hypothetical protein